MGELSRQSHEFQGSSASPSCHSGDPSEHHDRAVFREPSRGGGRRTESDFGPNGCPDGLPGIGSVESMSDQVWELPKHTCTGRACDGLRLIGEAAGLLEFSRQLRAFWRIAHRIQCTVDGWQLKNEAYIPAKSSVPKCVTYTGQGWRMAGGVFIDVLEGRMFAELLRRFWVVPANLSRHRCLSLRAGSIRLDETREL